MPCSDAVLREVSWQGDRQHSSVYGVWLLPISLRLLAGLEERPSVSPTKQPKTVAYVSLADEYALTIKLSVRHESTVTGVD